VKSIFVHKLPTATLLLWLFAFGCSDPAYRLHGEVKAKASSVFVLPHSAAAMLDSIRDAHGIRRDSLTATYSSRRDSLSTGGADIEKVQGEIQRRVKVAQIAYNTKFDGAGVYRSFGGNPVFTTQDRGVRTSDLLKEIADRFYKGRAFSLETETKLRKYIRTKLVPAERKLRQARTALARARESMGGNTEALERMDSDYQTAQLLLEREANNQILSTLDGMVLKRAVVDSSGNFDIYPLSSGKYYLYAPYPLPQGWLVSVDMTSHRRQDLREANTTNLLIRDG
jgi:hypothetical protein